MGLGTFHSAPPITGVQKDGEAAASRTIARGHVCLMDATDKNLVTRSAAENAAGAKGIALVNSTGDGCELALGWDGIYPVKNTSGGNIAANVALVSDDAGGVKGAAVSNLNIIGHSLEASADGDLFSARILIRTQVAPA